MWAMLPLAHNNDTLGMLVYPFKNDNVCTQQTACRLVVIKPSLFLLKPVEILNITLVQPV